VSSPSNGDRRTIGADLGARERELVARGFPSLYLAGAGGTFLEPSRTHRAIRQGGTMIEMMAVRPLTAEHRLRTRVLLAIDDVEMMQHVSSTLERDDHQVIELEDGDELLDYLDLLARHPARISRPDAVVAQLSLPGVSGLEVLQRQRAFGDTTPYMLLVDGHERSADVQAARRAAAFIFSYPRDLFRLTHLLRAHTLRARRA
jgi:CheY-like chemotaxis protein